jgi:hypothetical protein
MFQCRLKPRTRSPQLPRFAGGRRTRGFVRLDKHNAVYLVQRFKRFEVHLSVWMREAVEYDGGVHVGVL